jgi:hypothetical protein
VGLGDRRVRGLGLSLFQSGVLYQPDTLARRIVNLNRTAEGSLETWRGLSTFEPRATPAFTDPVSGICHVETFGGANQVTLIRKAAAILRHQGWDRSWSALKTGLVYDANPRYPDVFVPINGLVVWCDGINRPLIIDCRTDGRIVLPLGFDQGPSAPVALSPSPGLGNAITAGGGSIGAGAGSVPPNWSGYSVPGNIGTVSQFNGEDGSLLASCHYYAVQWEDPWGNLSPLSPNSNAATITEQSCGYVSPTAGAALYTRVNHLDMLQRGFFLRGIDVGEENVKAVRLYRTTDTLHSDGDLHLLSRIEGRQSFGYSDSASDGTVLAGDVPTKVVAVEPFQVACEYQGRLVVGNLASNASMVRVSQPNAIGTFEENAYVIAPGGSEVTGLRAFAGYCYVLTDREVFRFSIGAAGIPVPEPVFSVGCVAPQSVQVLPNGQMAWLSRTSAYMHDGTKTTEIGEDILDKLAKLNVSVAGLVAGAVDPSTGNYLLAVPINSATNTTVLSYDIRTDGWREYDAEKQVLAFHACSGYAGTLLCAVADPAGGSENVMVWDSPSFISGAVGAASTYESVEIRYDKEGRTPFRVRELLIGFLESDGRTDDPGLTVTVWKTSRKVGTSPTANRVSYTAELVGQDFGTTWALGEVTLNGTEAYYRDPAVVWRSVKIDVTTTTGFYFTLSIAAGRRMNLLGFAIIAEPTGDEASRIPGPTRTVS